MKATLLSPVDAMRIDDESFINLLVLIDPKAACGRSQAYRDVRQVLMERDGWSEDRVIATVHRLTNARRIFLSKTKKSISLIPVFNRSRKRKQGTCVYCGATSNQITLDHVKPKSQGGSDHPSNIVPACFNCNQSKGNRTPERWAADVLRARRYTSTGRPAAAWYTVRSWAIRLAVMVAVAASKGGAQ